MSELDTYLVVGFFCLICAFFISLGTGFMRREKAKRGMTKPERGLAFSLCTCVNFCYYVAWLWLSYQPLLKLIPIFILSAVVARITDGLDYEEIGSWLPLVGIAISVSSFHALRYVGVI